MREITFPNKKIREEELIPFGFTQTEKEYVYTCELQNGQFTMRITVIDGKIYTEVLDKDLGEEYILHLVPDAAGRFVGLVRAEYDAVISRFISCCCENDIFKSEQSRDIINYVREKYGDEPEYLWKKFPNNAVWRRQDNGKWYGAILTVTGNKLGFSFDAPVEILDLRILPEDLRKTVDNVRFLPGYHMNKQSWYTICLNGTVENREIYKRMDESYMLAAKK